MAFKRRPRPMAPSHAGCGKHPVEPATDRCHHCGRGCCSRCALPVRRRVLCIDCGLVVGGISTRRAT